jgi:hypothetical protein
MIVTIETKNSQPDCFGPEYVLKNPGTYKCITGTKDQNSDLRFITQNQINGLHKISTHELQVIGLDIYKYYIFDAYDWMVVYNHKFVKTYEKITLEF